MKGFPSAETAAYSDICDDFEQRIGNPVCRVMFGSYSEETNELPPPD